MYSYLICEKNTLDRSVTVVVSTVQQQHGSSRIGVGNYFLDPEPVWRVAAGVFVIYQKKNFKLHASFYDTYSNERGTRYSRMIALTCSDPAGGYK